MAVHLASLRSLSEAILGQAGGHWFSRRDPCGKIHK